MSRKRTLPEFDLTDDNSDRKWWVLYNLMYDGGGEYTWIGYHKHKSIAQIARFWNKHISSWGGQAELISREDAVCQITQGQFTENQTASKKITDVEPKILIATGSVAAVALSVTIIVIRVVRRTTDT